MIKISFCKKEREKKMNNGVNEKSLDASTKEGQNNIYAIGKFPAMISYYQKEFVKAGEEPLGNVMNAFSAWLHTTEHRMYAQKTSHDVSEVLFAFDAGNGFIYTCDTAGWSNVFPIENFHPESDPDFMENAVQDFREFREDETLLSAYADMHVDEIIFLASQSRLDFS